MFRIAGLRVVSCRVTTLNLPTSPNILKALAIVLLFAQAAVAQGIQPFSTQAPGPFSTVDLATSNVLISIPIRTKIGVIPFQYSLIANSSPQTGMAQSGLGGSLLGAGALLTAQVGPFTTQRIPCAGQYASEYENWTYVDATGAAHRFPRSLYIIWGLSNTSCDTIGPKTAQATDGSGYTLTVTVAQNGLSYSTQLWDKSGNTKPEYTNAVSDPDGNSISSSWVAVGNTGIAYTYKDTLGQTALTATTYNPPSTPSTYVYTNKSGGNQTYTVAYTSMHWKTVFSGKYCGDYDVPESLFPTTITETPSGQQYTLAYEPTPGYPTGYTTGRIQQIAFPSGGYIQYTYSGGSYGLN